MHGTPLNPAITVSFSFSYFGFAYYKLSRKILSSHSRQWGEAKWQDIKESKTCEGGEKKKKNNFKDRYMGHVVNLVGVKVKRSNFPF